MILNYKGMGSDPSKSELIDKLAEKDREINEKKIEIYEKKIEIYMKDREISKRDREISKKNKEINEKEEKIEELEAELNELKKKNLKLMIFLIMMIVAFVGLLIYLIIIGFSKNFDTEKIVFTCISAIVEIIFASSGYFFLSLFKENKTDIIIKQKEIVSNIEINISV